MEQAGRLDRGDGVHLAWRSIAGRDPTIVFLPGFASDMAGAKAEALAAWAAASGQAMLRFDYSGHGKSDGEFAEGTIGQWTADALCVLERLVRGKVLLVGSSMGGWIALLTARTLGPRVAGLVGIAAAPDFTEELMWDAAMPHEREALLARGFVDTPSQYGPPLRITRRLIEDGRQHLLLREPLAVDCPVRLLHGQRDPDVPWQTALRITERLRSENVLVTLIKDGDHRLSRAQDLALLERSVVALLQPSAADD